MYFWWLFTAKLWKLVFSGCRRLFSAKIWIVCFFMDVVCMSDGCLQRSCGNCLEFFCSRRLSGAKKWLFAFLMMFVFLIVVVDCLRRSYVNCFKKICCRRLFSEKKFIVCLFMAVVCILGGCCRLFTAKLESCLHCWLKIVKRGKCVVCSSGCCILFSAKLKKLFIFLFVVDC